MGWSTNEPGVWYPDVIDDKLTSPAPGKYFAFIRSADHTKQAGEIVIMHWNAPNLANVVELPGIIIRKEVEPGVDKVSIDPHEWDHWWWRSWVCGVVASQQP